MSIIQQIPITTPDGEVLATGGKYCMTNLQVIPKLLPITLRKNGAYPVPKGYAGYGELTVDVSGKKEEVLSVTQNGKYTPLDGSVFSSVEVNVPVKEEISLDVTENATYTAPDGKTYNPVYVNVPSQAKEELDLNVTGNGTYSPPDGKVYKSVVVNVSGESKEEITLTITKATDATYTPPDGQVYSKVIVRLERDKYIDVGEYITINMGDAEAYRVDYPSSYLHYHGNDGGELVFTGIQPGSGSIVISQDMNVVYELTFSVNEIAEFDYTVAVGNSKSISYADEYVTKVQSVTGCISCGDLDSDAFDITGVSVGYDIVLVYRTLDGGATYDLHEVYTVNVTAAGSGGSGDSGGTTTPTISEINGGTKTVGAEWSFMASEYTDEYTITSITGGIGKVEKDGDIYLLAISAGEASVTVKKSDGSQIQIWKYTIVASSGGGSGGGTTTCTHANTEVLSAVAATCTATGLTEGKKCSDCGEIITAQEVVPAKGHTEVIDDAVAATCTATGLTEGKHCSACSTVITEQEVTPATGHNYTMIKDSSSSRGASMMCKCGDSYEVNYDCDILGHETSEGPHDVDGEQMYKCKHCGEFYV